MTEPQLVIAQSGFAAILKSHPDAIYVYDLDGRFVDCNPALEAMTGYSLAELRTMTFGPIVHPDDRDQSWDFFRQAAAGETVRYTARAVTKAGDPLLIDVTKLPLLDDQNEIVGVVGIARSIAELAKALDRAELDQATLRIAGRLARVAGWAIDLPSRQLRWSAELLELLELEPGGEPDLEGTYLLHATPHRAAMRKAVEACIEYGEPIDLESVLWLGDGSERYVHIRGEAVRNERGAIVRVHGAFSDITDDVAERENRKRIEGLLSNTLNQISDAMCFVDRDWRFTFVNSSFERLANASSSVLLGTSVWDRYPEVWPSTFGRAYRDAMYQGVVTSTRAYSVPFERWLDARAYPTDDGIAIYLQDVTNDQQMLDALELSNMELREKAELLDNARDAILVRDLEHRIRYWNRAASELYGWDREEVTGVSVRELLYIDPTRFDEATGTVLGEGFWKGEIHQNARDGRSIIVDARWQLLRDDKDEPYAVLSVSSDITATKREETKLIQAQRLESLGTLAGGIAHDLNNVLTPVLLSVQLLDEAETDGGRRQLLKSMEAGIRRGAEMIKQVLSFARGIEGQHGVIDVSGLVGELETLSKYTLPKSIEIRTNVEDDLWPLVGDSTQVMQVLVNLVTNAQDAMPHGGTISLGARNHELAADYVPTADGAAPGRYVLLEVEDTGEGMAEEVATRIFEPFFTTKEVGRGTGLGLATSMSIVQSHGGFISLYSELGSGTRFRVHLPAADATLEGEEIAPASAEIARGFGERILLIDDEEMILVTVRRILEDNGYETTVAVNGRQGIDAIEDSEDRFDLVITDMMMPVMGGAETVAHLAQHHPDIAVIAASGLSANGDIARESHPGILEFIDKPFSRVELLQSVRRALDERKRKHAP